jgi:serine/threonine-protein kinase
MSPEQIRSAKHVEPRSDQHALGAILYELLTGRVAYGAESLTALAVEISTAPSPSARAARPEVPAGLDAAIRQALAKAPAGRFPNLAEFAAAIAPFGGPQARAAAARIAEILAPKRSDSVVSTSPTTSVSRYPRAIRRRPLIAVVAVGALVGAGIVALTRGSGDDGPQRGPLVTTETPAAGGATVVPSPAAAELLPAPVATATAAAAPSATATRSSPPERKKPVKKTGGTSKPSALPSPGEVFGGGP